MSRILRHPLGILERRPILLERMVCLLLAELGLAHMLVVVLPSRSASAGNDVLLKSQGKALLSDRLCQAPAYGKDLIDDAGNAHTLIYNR